MTASPATNPGPSSAPTTPESCASKRSTLPENKDAIVTAAAGDDMIELGEAAAVRPLSRRRRRAKQVLRLPYADIIIAARLANRALAMAGEMSPDNRERFLAEAAEVGMTPEQYQSELRRLPALAATYALDAKKQNLHEKNAAYAIKERIGSELVQGFLSLPNGGANSWQLVERDGGLVCTRLEDVREGEKTLGKSIDFAWRCGDFVVIAAHKHTDQGGGSQGSQGKELMMLMRHVAASATPVTVDIDGYRGLRVAVVSLADGRYYTDRTKRSAHRNRISLYAAEAREARARGHHAYATNIHQLPKILTRLADAPAARVRQQAYVALTAEQLAAAEPTT